MTQKPKRNVKKGIANIFGSFGYLCCFLLWFWAVILYFSVLQSLIVVVSPATNEQVRQVPNFSFTVPGPLETTLLVAVTIIMVIITIYALVMVPRGIVKTSQKIVHKTAEAITPVVIKSQHKKNTKSLREHITPRLVIVAKLFLILIPILLTAASWLLNEPAIDYIVAMVVGVWLAGLGVLFFTIQYTVARIFDLKLSDIW